MRKLLFIVLTALLVVGCGRKEAPQTWFDPSEPEQAWLDKGEPRIATLDITDAAPSKRLSIELSGGEGGVGYQLQRAEMDPFCQCPGTWHPYYEEPPLRRNEGKTLEKMLRFELGSHAYVYRLRAIDALGRLSPWSETILLDMPAPQKSE